MAVTSPDWGGAWREGIRNATTAFHWPHWRQGMALCTFATQRFAATVDEVDCSACKTRLHADAARRLGAGSSSEEEIKKSRCVECGELKVDPEDFYDGLRCRACCDGI